MIANLSDIMQLTPVATWRLVYVYGPVP